MSWYLTVLRQYAVFEGRARRKEYWMFYLWHLIIAVALYVLESIAGSGGFILTFYQFAVLLPSIAVSVRRLHDTGRSGWWLLIGFIPVIGPIVFLVFMLQDGYPMANQYGANPKE